MDPRGSLSAGGEGPDRPMPESHLFFGGTPPKVPPCHFGQDRFLAFLAKINKKCQKSGLSLYGKGVFFKKGGSQDRSVAQGSPAVRRRGFLNEEGPWTSRPDPPPGTRRNAPCHIDPPGNPRKFRDFGPPGKMPFFGHFFGFFEKKGDFWHPGVPGPPPGHHLARIFGQRLPWC